MSSLKDALLKAGLKASSPQVLKKDKPKRHGPKNKVHTHQGHRTFCEVCNRTLPDVEHYNHRNPTVKANWICVQCADSHSISDNFRTTNQSEHSRQRIFRREYGPTKRFAAQGPKNSDK
ncbi:MAG: hypothetical protein OEY33_08645 [Bdellovibrionales bacterium]|jgi:hypothetical protein|nr:hypothetical protein [Bdellovibrionales bacterium]